jgi:hypothetical protein
LRETRDEKRAESEKAEEDNQKPERETKEYEEKIKQEKKERADLDKKIEQEKKEKADGEKVNIFSVSLWLCTNCARNLKTKWQNVGGYRRSRNQTIRSLLTCKPI